MKVEKLSERDQKALLGLIMLLAVALAYFVGYKGLLNSAAVTKNENLQLQTRLEDLKEKDKNKKQVLEDTQECEAKINVLAQKYPSKVTPEKVFYDMYNLDVALGKTAFTSVVAEMNGLFYPVAEGTEVSADNTQSTQTVQDHSEKPGFSDGIITAYKTQVTTQIKNMSYSALKKMIKEINSYDGRMTMDNMNLIFSKESGLLEGSVVYEMYELEGSPKEYAQPDIRMPSGVKNIFGTFDAK
ncbi:hypothetical protein [[Clostridium] polysaccharolyticum]|uniref:Pilus assembly protein PilO n=1 Tax=[Clostridium] polysaccharolyticum TaxID=29364 RepID=A0A1H9ZSR6_9FIRM|nr:hypothetical protein [[Clostridium] polysaccharolyticum]SES84274.1 hypothetical protein SAMN04487772_10480 [[Clostridium] polysaccharolyticum]